MTMLTRIIAEYRESYQFEPLEPDDLETRARAFLPVTLCIPLRELYPTYVYVMQNRKPEKSLSAVELVDGYRARLDGREVIVAEPPASRLLTENAPKGCERCFGTGFESKDEKGVGKDCSHAPLTKAEKKARDDARDLFVKKAQELRVAPNAPRVVARTPSKPSDLGVALQCDSCGRRASTNEGWQIGERCGRIIEGKKLCEGTFLQYTKKD